MAYKPSDSNWEAVIGLEIHVQLKTNSKLFSPAPTDFGAPPNSQAHVVDLGLPGVLPVLNRKAVSYAIRFGLATGSQIASMIEFDRKNYFYPDLPKGYQISQLAHPIVTGGSIWLEKSQRVIGLTRAHLEEDAGKSIHGEFAGRTAVDLNRAGVPLLEIVSEPDMRSVEEAGEYLRKLHSIVRWIDICDGEMAQGSFRCDANISIRERGASEYGERCEIKNVNSFRFVEKALAYEIDRQIDLLSSGGQIERATLLFDEKTGTTAPMRGKELSADYRYFPDPDLLPLNIDAQWIDEVRQSLPELPEQAKSRLMADYSLSEHDAGLLTADQQVLAYFERVAAICQEARLAANWINGEIAARLKDVDSHEAGDTTGAYPIAAETLGNLLVRVADQSLSSTAAKQVLAALWEQSPEAEPAIVSLPEIDSRIDQMGLRQISDGGQLEQLVAQVLEAHAEQVAQYRSGKTKVLGFLVGQVMKASKGSANPAQLKEIMTRMLS
ncbi:MAG: Asp-tRNA(Asn)/Glu-tRNA(Gln) amidotransferase subunit GatB [Gammaproteobacteria bacterium]